jgi:heme exporter protein C
MWFGMIALFGTSVFYAIRYLYKENELDDVRSLEFINTGILYGICGLITGSIWAKYTWGQWWVIADPKLNGAAIVMLEYFAYLILRGSITDEKQKAKVSAVYNIFACASIIPLLFILPRMADSLHPGNGGNPGFSKYDLDNNMRMVFYPAVAGWIMIGVWFASVRVRLRKLENAIHES